MYEPKLIHTRCSSCGCAEVLAVADLDWSFNADRILTATHLCAACGEPISIQGMKNILAVKAARAREAEYAENVEDLRRIRAESHLSRWGAW
jgi:hypothetical protein